MARLPLNLPQLQNLIKRDPPSYVDEFKEHHGHFMAHMDLFEANPGQYSKTVCEQVMFLSQVSHCYKEEMADFPDLIISLLRRHYSVLNSEVRIQFCRALILMRNKDLVTPSTILELFFVLFRCQDKLLRKILFQHIVTDIKNINAKHRNNAVNRSLQNFMYSMLKDSHTTAAKMSLDAMVELYKKQVWRDTKTVNVIVTACLSPKSKIMATGIRFFLGADEVDSDDDSSSDEEDSKPSARKLVIASGVNKKTVKRRRKLEKQLAKVNKVKKRKKKGAEDVPNFSALHLIHDPQEFAEQLFKRLESENHAFDLRLNILTLIGRLVGVHKLILFNFYPYVQRFLKPQQRDVTKLLMITAQATHEMVPADIIEPVMRTIADNFVTERNASEVMAVGLNAAREIYTRCPLAMGDGTLLRDFVEYKSHRDRGVSTAGRSMMQLARALNAELLNRKDRGKPGVDRDVQEDDQFGEGDEEEDKEDNDDDEEDGDEDDDDDEEDEEMDEDDGGECEDDMESSDEDGQPKEIVTMEDIAMVNMRRRRDRDARLATVLAGREGREKYGARRPKMNPYASTTNKEKQKKKNFMMLRSKQRFKRTHRSFRDRQIAMRKAMTKNKRGTK